MTPATVRAALEALVVFATDVEADMIFWKNRPMVMTDDLYVECKLSAYGAHGRDSVEYDYDIARPVGEELEPHQRGLRSVVWQVQFWSHEATDTEDAFSQASALRDRLHLDEVRDALQAAEIGVGEVLLLTEIDALNSDREMSVAQLDIQLNSVSDVTGTKLGYVEQWGVTGTATLSDGTSDTIVDEVMP
jgi:hypothetical protein